LWRFFRQTYIYLSPYVALIIRSKYYGMGHSRIDSKERAVPKSSMTVESNKLRIARFCVLLHGFLLRLVSYSVFKISIFCHRTSFKPIAPLITHSPRSTLPCLRLKRSAQVQYNYNTTAIQIFFLYCSCIALVRTALDVPVLRSFIKSFVKS